jgi:protein phosphatase PTC7
MIPHPKRKYRGGEDAFFIHPKLDAVGVADGVGLWSQEKGINPALFAQTSMQGAANTAIAGSAMELLVAGWNKVIADKIVGSSTACIVLLDRERKEINAVNLGDSGLILVRNREIALRTEQQLHYFNCPFQMGFDVDGDYLKFEKPQDGEQIRFTVEDNDILVLATDGLFDNVEERDIAEIVENHRSKSAEEIAKCIAEVGFEKSVDKSVDSPFAIQAKDNNFMWSGGIQDDITVVVGKI